MKKLNSFELVSNQLKFGEIVYILKPQKLFFALKGSLIQVKNDHTQYQLSWEAFTDLFKQADFFLYERKEEVLVDKAKDDEYYGWKNK